MANKLWLIAFFSFSAISSSWADGSCGSCAAAQENASNTASTEITAEVERSQTDNEQNTAVADPQ